MQSGEIGRNMAMKTLILALIVLTALLCLPLCVGASGQEETEAACAAALGNYTKSDFQNFWQNKDPRGVDPDPSQKDGLPKDGNGKYIVPDGSNVIDLGDDGTGTGNHSYLVVKDDVKIINATNFSISEVESSRPSLGELPRQYQISPSNNGGSLNVAAGDKVVIVLPESGSHCFNCGEVASYSNGLLTLKGKAETDHTLFSYLTQYHVGGKHFSKTWHIKEEEVPIKVGSLKLGDATFEGDFTISGHADGNIYPLFVDMEFVTELDFGGKDSTNVTTYDSEQPAVTILSGSGSSSTVPGNLVQKGSVNEESKHILVHLETMGAEFSVPLIPVAKIELVPLILEINLSPEFFIECTGTGDIGFQFYLQEGFSYYHKVRIFRSDIVHHQRIHDGPKFADFAADVTGSVYVGIQWGPGLEVLEGALTIEVVYKGGAVFEGTIDTNGFDPKDPDQKVWHACEAKCVQGDGHPRLGPLSAVAKCFLFTEDLFDLIKQTDYKPFLTFYHSYLFNDYDSQWNDSCVCPHKAWRTDVTVSDAGGNKLKGASITYTPNISDHYNKYRNLTTNDNGYARLYLPYDKKTDTGFPNTNFDVEVSCQKYGQTFTAKQTLPTKNEWRQIDFNLDIRQCTLSFAYEVGSGTVGNMPEPIVFYPGISKKVTIPDEVPAYSGFKFLGWNKTKPTIDTPIPGGTYYQPKDVIELNDDCTLYAIWNVNEIEYFAIIYNDNGGSGGPGREVFKTNAAENTVRLSQTKPQPQIETQQFLGWSTDQFDYDEQNLLQPGSIYNKRETVILYAQYSNYSPVVPVNIMFYPNGDSVTGVPPLQKVQIHAWSKLTSQTPEWDPQHIFLGWSRNPDDTVGRYYPGHYHYFSQDTDLYAIWQRDYHIIEQPTDMTYLRYSGRTLRFVGNGAYKYFNYLAIDELPTADGNYTLSAGSTVIELKPEYLDTLSDGEHTVRILYYDGETDPVTITVETVHYFFASGDGQAWTKNSKDALGFIIKGDKDDENTYQKFTGIQVDGQAVSVAGYTTQSGSLKLWLQPVFLQNLDDGKHTLTVLFSDGKAEGSFQIQKPVPKTGDSAQPALWLALIAAGIGALAVLCIRTSRK